MWFWETRHNTVWEIKCEQNAAGKNACMFLPKNHQVLAWRHSINFNPHHLLDWKWKACTERRIKMGLQSQWKSKRCKKPAEVHPLAFSFISMAFAGMCSSGNTWPACCCICSWALNRDSVFIAINDTCCIGKWCSDTAHWLMASRSVMAFASRSSMSNADHPKSTSSQPGVALFFSSS